MESFCSCSSCFKAPLFLALEGAGNPIFLVTALRHSPFCVSKNSARPSQRSTSAVEHPGRSVRSSQTQNRESEPAFFRFFTANRSDENRVSSPGKGNFSLTSFKLSSMTSASACSSRARIPLTSAVCAICRSH